MQFEGYVCGQPVLILLDYGNSASFISTTAVAKLSDVQLQAKASTMKVARGGVLHYLRFLSQLPWSIDHCSFTSYFRVLDLQSFDVIVSMDWLSAFSPMHIHWEQKWLAFRYNKQLTVLEGMSSQRPTSLYLQVCQLSNTNCTEASQISLPPKIDALINQFQHLFKPPTSLPPS
jgi:hypothetical protein